GTLLANTSLFPYTTLFRSNGYRQIVVAAKTHVVASVTADQVAGRQARFEEQHLAQFNLGLRQLIAIDDRWVLGDGFEGGFCAIQDRKSTRLNSSHVKNSYD